MTIQHLIDMARARLAHLSQLRSANERLGDAVAVARVDAEMAETQATLDQLLGLPA